MRVVVTTGGEGVMQRGDVYLLLSYNDERGTPHTLLAFAWAVGSSLRTMHHITFISPGISRETRGVLALRATVGALLTPVSTRSGGRGRLGHMDTH